MCEYECVEYECGEYEYGEYECVSISVRIVNCATKCPIGRKITKTPYHLLNMAGGKVAEVVIDPVNYYIIYIDLSHLYKFLYSSTTSTTLPPLFLFTKNPPKNSTTLIKKYIYILFY